MKEVWNSIERKLIEIAPKIVKKLNKPVKDKDVEKLEKAIKTKLPKNFIDFYKVHNGQKEDSPGLIDCEELLSFDRMLEEWEIWKELLDAHDFEENGKPITSSPDSGIKNNWWNPLWIPITADGAGNHFCLDLDPAENGNCGQIIRMWHDDGERSLEAASFVVWITTYKDQLVNGQLVYSKDDFGIIDKDDIDEE